MFKPRSRFVVLVISLATVLAALCRSEFAEGQSFRDPLTGKTSSTKRGDKPSKPALLRVALTEEKPTATQKAGEVFLLSIQLKLPEGGYTYSTDPGFTGATRIKVTQTEGVEPLDEQFFADHDPHVEFQADFGQSVEKFKEEVTWTRRFRVKLDAKRNDVRILSQVRYQICDSSNCTPYDETFFVTADAPAEVIATEASKVAEFKSRFVPVAPKVEPQPQPKTEVVDVFEVKPFETELIPQRGKKADPVKVRVRLSPQNAQPGESVLLSVTMELESPWHTFALDQDELKSPGLPALITIDGTNGLKKAEEKFAPSLVPEIERTDEGQEQRVHHKQITWTMPFVVEKANYGLSVSLGYQICRTGTCLPFKQVAFSLGNVAVAPPAPAPPTRGSEDPKPTTSVATSTTVEDPNEDLDTAGKPLNQLLTSFKNETFVVEDDSEGSLGQFLIYAFLGGLILNVMPCVLPVIAIKIFSFLKQAGESRGRILALNLMYAVGVVFVFLILASLAVFAKFGWGGLFQETGFQVAMACVVFAMGLSLLGVFEIPLPGLIGSAASHQHQEGLFGAFLTGIFATLLATPCSGPFLGVTLGWSVKQPAHITYLVWSVMGLGMASPYIVLGFFPGWVKYLPKPGNWMVIFKEICGLLLLATVIFLMTSLRPNWIFPTLILLLALGCALWMIGRLYTINSSDQRRWTVRSFASLTCLVGWLMASSLADETPNAAELPWKPFSTKVVDTELKSGRTVLIDFTASWCVTCKTNKRLALNQAETLGIVKEHNVVTLKADWSNGSPEVSRWLHSFNSESIPFLVIFPGKDPTHPIVIRDAYTKSTLLKKLQEAVTAESSLQQVASQR